MDYKEEIVQIMPAPDRLFLWWGDTKGKKTPSKPLCLALVKMYLEDGTTETEVRYVEAEKDGSTIAYTHDSAPEFLGVTYEESWPGEQDMNDYDKRLFKHKAGNGKGIVV
jgi:hypothetical protein